MSEGGFIFIERKPILKGEGCIGVLAVFDIDLILVVGDGLAPSPPPSFEFFGVDEWLHSVAVE